MIKTEKYGIVGIAQKIVDGNQRANETAMMAILNHLNLLQPEERELLLKYNKPIENETRKLVKSDKTVLDPIMYRQGLIDSIISISINIE